MVLGSHNSWSYITPKKWWMKLIRFTAKCQCKNIQEQYNLGARYFDLRLRGDDIVHGPIVFDVTKQQVYEDLQWLNDKGNVVVRVLLDARNAKEYTSEIIDQFVQDCKYLEQTYQNIQFDCGRNLYNWNMEYDFHHEFTTDDLYASVAFPRLIDDWIPIIYAKLRNKANIKRGTDKDILLIDFVNIQ